MFNENQNTVKLPYPQFSCVQNPTHRKSNNKCEAPHFHRPPGPECLYVFDHYRNDVTIYVQNITLRTGDCHGKLRIPPSPTTNIIRSNAYHTTSPAQIPTTRIVTVQIITSRSPDASTCTTLSSLLLRIL